MEVSNEIKEEIRKTQTDLKNAIRIHQVWIARLQDDEHNSHLKCKVNEAEKDILSIGQTQKRVVERLRRELELYQQRLKARNKQVNVESDNRYIAQQLRDHQLQYKSKNKSISLLKPSVLSEIHIKSENNTDTKNNSSYENSDAENEQKITAEECKDKENGSFTDLENSTLRESKSVKDNSFINNVQDSRLNFTNALNKAKESFIGHKQHGNTESWQDGSGSPGSEQFSPQNASELSPTPSPPPLPGPGELITQEAFLRLVGLVTPRQKDALEKKRSERKKRSTTSTNKNEFIYGNFDLPPKRKKYNQFPYLQSTATPPQTRSQRLRRQQKQQAGARGRDSREGSPSGSSSDNKGGPSFVQQPPWAASLPSGLTVEPVHSGNRRSCAGCGRSDVPSLLIHCGACSCSFHTGCGASAARASPGAPRLCPSCGCEVREARLHGATVAPAGSRNGHSVDIFKDIPFSEKQLERKLLQEKNAQLSLELRKLEVRAANLKENLDAHNAEKSELLSHQIRTQRNLQKLLDFVGQFKETSISIRSTSGSDTASERSKSNEE